MGLEGLLSQRREHLVGILNGIDSETWDPACDPYLEHLRCGFTAAKGAEQDRLCSGSWAWRAPGLPLLGFVGRLVEQKGLELMLPVLEQTAGQPGPNGHSGHG